MESIKPLRNYLRRLNCLSFLQAIWSLANHLEFGQPLPAHLAAANPGNKEPLRLEFFLWELDTLAREAILHCETPSGAPVTGWRQVAVALVKLREAEQGVSRVDETNVLAEISRIAHRQFNWQQGVSYNDLVRTRRIYRHPGMSEVVRGVYGLSAEDVALAGFAALATFLGQFAITSDWPEEVAEPLGLNPRPLIENLAADLATLRRSAREASSLDGNWAYAFNPLWLHPLIRVGGGVTVCPLPGLLARRFTDGLYYDTGGHDADALGREMGPAFQAFIGEVLERAGAGDLTVLPERRFGTKGRKRDSVDWIVSDETATLLVEVKVLKMKRAAKEELAPARSVTEQLGKLAAAIGQLYATLTDALAGDYPHWKPDRRPVHPVLVTLDDWHLFTHDPRSQLATLIDGELDRRGIERTLLKSHRYVICSSNELESAVQVMRRVGIHEVMRDLTTGEKVGWLFATHVRDTFAEELRHTNPLFPEERASLMARVAGAAS